MASVFRVGQEAKEKERLEKVWNKRQRQWKGGLSKEE